MLEVKEEVSLEGKVIGDLYFDGKVGGLWCDVMFVCLFMY